MNRLDQTFADLKTKNRKALIAYTMAGDPNAETSLAIWNELAARADILEIGMAFTDPMADGPVIQAAGLRALAAGMTLSKTLALLRDFRSKNDQTPIILMGYFNPLLSYSVEKFMSDCAVCGIDGLIIVDIPPEEAEEVVPLAARENLRFIRLVTPTTDKNRLSKILPGAGGFLYYVSITGVTGMAAADPEKVRTHIQEIKTMTDLPVVAGFGIRTAEDAANMAAVADGIVVGSAFVQTIATAGSDASQAIARQVTELADAINR